MGKMIDRMLDRKHLVEQIGCRESDLKPTGQRKFISDDDLCAFFDAEPTRVLCRASFRDGQYTIDYAEAPVEKPPKKTTPKKKTAKKAAAKKAAKKKKGAATS